MLRLGALLSERTDGAAYFALYGGLGAGKTVLCRGFLQRRGADAVTSPTFTIVHEYAFSPAVYHIDAYRLSGADELYAVGYDDILGEPCVILVEWADLVADALPRERLDVTVAGSGASPRTVTLAPHGARYERMVADL